MWKSFYYHWNCTDICQQLASIVSDNGAVPYIRQPIIWTNDSLSYRSINVPFNLSELNWHNLRTSEPFVDWAGSHKKIYFALQWRHNGRDGITNHQPHHCLLNRFFSRRSKKISKLHVTGLCARNSPVTGEFPAQMASNEENVSIWWRHDGKFRLKTKLAFGLNCFGSPEYTFLISTAAWTTHGATSFLLYTAQFINILVFTFTYDIHWRNSTGDQSDTLASYDNTHPLLHTVYKNIKCTETWIL